MVNRKRRRCRASSLAAIWRPVPLPGVINQWPFLSELCQKFSTTDRSSSVIMPRASTYVLDFQTGVSPSCWLGGFIPFALPPYFLGQTSVINPLRATFMHPASVRLRLAVAIGRPMQLDKPEWVMAVVTTPLCPNDTPMTNTKRRRPSTTGRARTQCASSLQNLPLNYYDFLSRWRPAFRTSVFSPQLTFRFNKPVMSLASCLPPHSQL
jgi:hypothetical protein